MTRESEIVITMYCAQRGMEMESGPSYKQQFKDQPLTNPNSNKVVPLATKNKTPTTFILYTHLLDVR